MDNLKPNPCLLVVDDDSEILALLTDILSPDYKIVSALGGHDALEKAGQTRFDAILTDLKMPGMDGAQLVGHLRSNPHTRHTPIIIVSAEDDGRKQVAGLGVQGFIEKPFKVNLIYQTVLQVLAARAKKPVDRRQIIEKTGALMAQSLVLGDRAANAIARANDVWQRAREVSARRSGMRPAP